MRKKVSLSVFVLGSILLSTLIIGMSIGSMVGDLRSLASPPLQGARCKNGHPDGFCGTSTYCYGGNLVVKKEGDPACNSGKYSQCIADGHTRLDTSIKCCSIPDNPVGSMCGRTNPPQIISSTGMPILPLTPTPVSIVKESNGVKTIMEDKLLNPTSLSTPLSLNQMDTLPDQLISDLKTRGMNMRVLAPIDSFDSNGHLKRDGSQFYGKESRITQLADLGVIQIFILDVTEAQTNTWLINAVTDIYKYHHPKGIIYANELNNGWRHFGNMENYYQRLSSIYSTVKSLNPSISVYPYGFAPLDLNYPNDLPKDYMEALFSYYENQPYSFEQKYPFDGVIIHVYLPKQIDNDIATLKQVMKKHHADFPILIGEIALATNDSEVEDYNSFINTPENQALYLWQAISGTVVQNASLVNYFTASDFDPNDTQQWGIVRRDGTTRPAYDAFKFAQKIFNNIQQAEKSTDRDIVITNLYRSDGIKIRLLQNESGNSKTYSNINTNALIYDIYGKRITPEIQNNHYLLDLPPRNSAFVKGDMKIIVEPK